MNNAANIVTPGEIVVIATEAGQVLKVLDTSIYKPAEPKSALGKLAKGVAFAGIASALFYFSLTPNAKADVRQSVKNKLSRKNRKDKEDNTLFVINPAGEAVKYGEPV